MKRKSDEKCSKGNRNDTNNGNGNNTVNLMVG